MRCMCYLEGLLDEDYIVCDTVYFIKVGKHHLHVIVMVHMFNFDWENKIFAAVSIVIDCEGNINVKSITY